MSNEEKNKGVAGVVSAVAEAIARGEGAPKPLAPEAPPDVTAELSIIEKAKEFGKKVAQNIVQAEKDLVKEGAHTAKDLAVVLKNPDVIELTKGITSEAVDQNPHLAAFLSDVAHASENLKNNPYFWLQEATRLRVWSMRSDLPNEVHADTSAVLRKVGVKIAELSQSHPDFDIPNWAVQHGISEVARMSMVPVPDSEAVKNPVDEIFDESGADVLANTPFEELLKKFQQFLRYDTSDQHDTHKISEYMQQIKEIGYRDKLPEQQVKEAINRLQRVADQSRLEGMRGSFIAWDEIKDKVPEGFEHNGGSVMQFRRLTDVDVDMLKKGEEEEWFYAFIDGIFGLSKERVQPTLDDMSKWEEFQEFVKWKYGNKDSERYLEEYRVHWNERGRHQHVINGLLYQPGDIKDRLRALRLITGADLDYYYKNFEHSNLASTFYEQAVMDLMADRRSQYDRNLTWLREEVDNGFYGEYKKGDKGKLSKVKEELKKFYGKEKLSRDEYYLLLKEENSKSFPDPNHPDRVQFGELMKPEFQLDMMEIKRRLDEVGEGVMLWDSDVQSYTELYLETQKMQTRFDALTRKKNTASASPEEIKEMGELKDRIDKKTAIYRQSKENDIESRKQLNDLRGMSPIDQEVRRRLLAFLEETGQPTPSEYKLRMAIWAARQASIASGHVVSIGAFQAIEPGRVPDEVYVRGIPELVEAYKSTHGKAVMRAPAFEDLQRFYNPELFAQRFGMGDDFGLRARHILTLSHLKEKGYDPKDLKITKTKLWKELGHAHGLTKEERLMRATMEAVEEDFGISFSQLLGPGFMSGGGDYDATSWRLEKGVADQIRQAFLEMKKQHPNEARLDNMALGIQLLVAGKDTDAKIRILDTMLNRTPSKFFQLVTHERDRVFERHHIQGEDWRYLKRALSMGEMKLWRDPNLQVAHVDLCRNEKDFTDHIVPFLKRLGAPESRYHEYFETLQDFQSSIRGERKTEKGKNAYKHESMLRAIADGRFPMTLSLSDFDWKEANFFQLGAIAMDRRGRDNEAMAAARDIMNDLLFQTEFLSPPSDPTETLLKIKELRKAVNTYADGDTAEKVCKEVLRVFLEFNKQRNLFGDSFPLVTRFARGLAEMEPEFWLGSRKPKWWINFLEKNHFLGQKINHLPHTIGEAISYSVRYTGSEGNAFDEKKIANIIATAQDIGIFTKNSKFANELRREFKATPLWRLLWVVRKYWWVVLFATVAYAALEETQEKKGH